MEQLGGQLWWWFIRLFGVGGSSGDWIVIFCTWRRLASLFVGGGAGFGLVGFGGGFCLVFFGYLWGGGVAPCLLAEADICIFELVSLGWIECQIGHTFQRSSP